MILFCPGDFWFLFWKAFLSLLSVENTVQSRRNAGASGQPARAPSWVTAHHLHPLEGARLPGLGPRRSHGYRFAVTAPSLQLTEALGVRRQARLLCVRPRCSTGLHFLELYKEEWHQAPGCSGFPPRRGCAAWGLRDREMQGAPPPRSAWRTPPRVVWTRAPAPHPGTSRLCICPRGKLGDERLVSEVLLGACLADSALQPHPGWFPGTLATCSASVSPALEETHLSLGGFSTKAPQLSPVWLSPLPGSLP